MVNMCLTVRPPGPCQSDFSVMCVWPKQQKQLWFHSIVWNLIRGNEKFQTIQPLVTRGVKIKREGRILITVRKEVVFESSRLFTEKKALRWELFYIGILFCSCKGQNLWEWSRFICRILTYNVKLLHCECPWWEAGMTKDLFAVPCEALWLKISGIICVTSGGGGTETV